MAVRRRCSQNFFVIFYVLFILPQVFPSSDIISLANEVQTLRRELDEIQRDIKEQNSILQSKIIEVTKLERSFNEKYDQTFKTLVMKFEIFRLVLLN